MEEQNGGDSATDTDNEEYNEPKAEANSKRSSYVWNYFKPLGSGSQALCYMCRKTFSYRTSITNLKKHLSLKHSDVVGDDNCLSRWNQTIKRNRKNKKKYSKISDDKRDSKVKFSSEILNQFEELDEDGENKCKHCKETVLGTLDDKKNHLEEQHSNVLDGIIVKVQKSQDSLSDEEIALDDNEMYTEVLYLEDETSNKTSYSPKRVKIQPKVCKRRKSVNLVEYSTKSYETVLKYEDEDEAEIEAFLNYVRLLLKKIPKEKSQKLHLDIINLIMNSQMSNVSEPRAQSTKVVETESIPSDNVESVLENNIVLIKAGSNTNGSQRLIRVLPHNELGNKVTTSTIS